MRVGSVQRELQLQEWDGALHTSHYLMHISSIAHWI